MLSLAGVDSRLAAWPCGVPPSPVHVRPVHERASVRRAVVRSLRSAVRRQSVTVGVEDEDSCGSILAEPIRPAIRVFTECV